MGPGTAPLASIAARKLGPAVLFFFHRRATETEARRERTKAKNLSRYNVNHLWGESVNPHPAKKASTRSMPISPSCGIHSQLHHAEQRTLYSALPHSGAGRTGRVAARSSPVNTRPIDSKRWPTDLATSPPCYYSVLRTVRRIPYSVSRPYLSNPNP